MFQLLKKRKKSLHPILAEEVGNMEDVTFEIEHERGIVELNVEVESFAFHIDGGNLTVRMNKDQAMKLYRSLGKLAYIWRKGRQYNNYLG